jgi:hypothetical protein
MARTIIEIKNDLLAKVAADAVLAPLLTSTSATALYKLWCYVFAVCAWSLETLFDIFKTEVDYTIAQDKTHRPQWYVNKAKDFQYGYNLVAEQDYYDNTGIADDVIAASKIVAYAAFVEEPAVRMKVAKLVGTNLAKLTTPERTAFCAYIKRIKDAGVKLHDTTASAAATITSTDPDKLRLVVRVKFNPLVLNGTGARIDGAAATPVKDAVKNYLQNIDFNGLFSVQKLVDAIQAVDGVDDLKVDGIQTKYGALPFTSVDIDFVPDSGYLIIEDVDFVPTYLPN